MALLIYIVVKEYFFVHKKNFGKMAFKEAQKASIAAKYIRNESATVTQRLVHTTAHKTPPSPNTILRWYTRFLHVGNMEHIGGNGIPRVSDQNVEDVDLSFEKKSSS